MSACSEQGSKELESTKQEFTEHEFTEQDTYDGSDGRHIESARASSDTQPVPSEDSADAVHADEVRPEVTARNRAYGLISLPHPSQGLATEGYDRIMRSRPVRSILSQGGKLDVTCYVPIFIYGIMTLPGTLAAYLEKPSPALVTDRMTPAALPGHLICQNPTTQRPCLVETGKAEHIARGILLFGQGRRQYNMLESHYQLSRKTVWPTFECLIPSISDGGSRCESMLTQRSSVAADTFGLSATSCPEHVASWVPWTLKDCIAGKFNETTSMDVL